MSVHVVRDARRALVVVLAALAAIAAAAAGEAHAVSAEAVVRGSVWVGRITVDYDYLLDRPGSTAATGWRLERKGRPAAVVALAGASSLTVLARAQADARDVAAAGPYYSIVDLGDWYPHSISSRGHVSGWGQLGSPGYYTRAVRWTPNTWPTGRSNLGPLPTFLESDGGAAVNADGYVVGWSANYGSSAGYSSRATLWRGGSPVDLGTLGGATGAAYGINDAGFVVGGARTAADETHAFLWLYGVMVDLGMFGGARTSAVDVNERNEIVGTATWASGFRGFIAVPVPGPLFASFPMLDLGTLGGMQTVASAINERTQVVGASTLPGVWHAFLWQKGLMKDLGTLTGPAGASSASDINASEQIVGSSVNAGGLSVPAYEGSSAVFWQGGAIVDLNTLVPANSGWHLTSAEGVNDSGRIVGWGVKLNQQFTTLRGFMLVPLVKLTAFTVQPAPVTGGLTAQGRITLNRPAPPGGATVSIASTFANPNPAATVPQVLVIPAGASTRTFPIATRKVQRDVTGKLTASYNGSTKIVTLKVRAAG